MLDFKARTLQPPRRSPDRVAFVFLAFAMACQPDIATQAQTQIDQALHHAEVAAQMLETAAGDQRKLLDAALAYRSAHHAELHELRTSGEAIWARLDVATKSRLASDADSRARPLLARMDVAAQKFANPRQALMLVQPFLLQASAHAAPADWKPWLPEPPKLPAERVAEPPPPTGTSR